MVAFGASLLLLTGTAWAQGYMTDEQVLEYVTQGLAEGKDQETLAAELSLRGVTRSQAERVYSLYQDSLAGSQAAAPQQGAGRAHSVNADEGEETGAMVAASDGSVVYGRHVFRDKSLNFAPSENLATPRNYRLGPGDEIIIDVFGRNQTTLRSTISPEGSINVDILGPLYLSGMTVDEANAYLKKRLSQIYGGLGSDAGTDIRLSLGQIRTIQVNMVGDLANPGTYVLSAFASAFHALYRAGGVEDPGTVRDIMVVRGDKVVGKVDVYDFLTRGSLSSDIRLEEGDVILVPPYKNMVSITGGVKRPMSFEMKDGETLADLLTYCGGFAHGAKISSVTLYRQNGKSFEVRTVEDSEYASFTLKDGDRIEVGNLQSLFENRTGIQGAVFFPGVYELGKDVHTAKDLIAKAGGLLPDAYTDRVVIHRTHDDRSMEVFSVNLTEILAGTRPDFILKNNDEVFVSSAYDLKEQGVMVISGMVRQPGTYPFAENTTVEDFIIMAGGLLDGASLSRVDITRRRKDANGLVASGDIADLYTISLEKGLADDGTREFVLERYDEVVVHRSPSFAVERHFTVSGEVNFPGYYSLTNREERVSDLVKKAGGLTDFAYKEGARLVRKATPEEMRQTETIADVIRTKVDTSAAGRDKAQRILEEYYTISLDLAAALSNPGGDADVILREGDALEIPVRNNVVRIHGAVMFPTAVNYDPSMKAADYISAAGGYSQEARRNKAYVVDLSGRAKKLKAGTSIKPGSEIYVPEKKASTPKRVDYNAMMAIATSAASIGTLGMSVVSLVNLLKK